MHVLNDARSSTPSDEEFIEIFHENDYCYRCIPLCNVDREKEERIYNLCTELKWDTMHTILSGANPSKLKGHIQRALTCTKCPPMNNLSEIKKFQAEITVMMRRRGRLEVLSVLTQEKKDAESRQKSMEEVHGKQINQKPDEVHSSSISWITEQTDQSKFCYRCMPLCHDDRMKENDVENALVLDMDEYVRRLLIMEFRYSKSFNAQETFDSALTCQNCPKIETTSQNEQMWAKILVLMRRQGRLATLKKVLNINNEAERAEQDAAATRIARSFDKHTRLRQTYSSLPKQPQKPKGGPLHSAGSPSDEVTGLGMGEHLALLGSLGIQCFSSVAEFQRKSLEKNQSSSSDPNGTTIPTSSNNNYSHFNYLFGAQENQQNGGETSSAISKNAPAPVYPETGSTRKRALPALGEGTQLKKSSFEMREEKDQSAGSPDEGTHELRITETNSDRDSNTLASSSTASTPETNQNDMNEAAEQNENAGNASEVDEQMEMDPPVDQTEQVVTEKTQETTDNTDNTPSPQPKTENEQAVASSLREGKEVIIEEENTFDSNTEMLKSKKQQTTLTSSENLASSSSVPVNILHEEREHKPESDTDAVESKAAASSEMPTHTDLTEHDDMQYDDREPLLDDPEEHLRQQVPEEIDESHQVPEEAVENLMHDEEALEIFQNPVNLDHDDDQPENNESANEDKDTPSTSEAKNSEVKKQNRKQGGRRINNKTSAEVERRKAIMNKQNTDWLLKQMLSFAYEKKKKDSNHVWKKDEEARVENCIKNWAEKSNPKHMPKRKDIELGTELPDRGNYRYCLDYLKRRCTAFETKPFGESSSDPKMTTVAPPTMRLTGTMHLEHNCTAEDVKKAALSSPTSKVNPVYKKEELVPPVPDNGLLKKEQDFYGLTKDDYHLPCPVVNVSNMDPSEIKKLEEISNGVPILLIQGLDTAAEIDLAKFAIEKMPIDRNKTEITVLNQVPQPAEQNKNDEGEDTWSIFHREEKIPLDEYLKYLGKVEKKADELYEVVIHNKTRGPEKKSNIDSFVDKMIREQDKPVSGDRNSPWSRFGTNVDLTGKDCEKLLEELQKLPEHLRPRSNKNLLSQLEVNVFGINTIQMYLKAIGSRTAAHMEHLLMASINWNLGPGPCLWYAVSYEYWGELEKLATKNGANYHHENYWPSEEELVKNKIPFYKFEQLAKEMVYLNSGCFHFVQSNSYCSNIAWNVGQPTFTQLAISMVAVDHNIQKKNDNIIPLAQIAWSVAEEKTFMDVPEVYELIRNILIRSLAHMEKYFLYIKENEKEFGVDPYGNASKNSWCTTCGCEVFNIVHWAVKKETNKKKEYPKPFCSGCTPPKGYILNELEFTYQRTLEELREIFDGYK
ncbi:hypothetical protein GCK72_025274 [Caenorhabditis remanei]|uniref:JmjC domain-containing protein n=1 Tax=Caenorhabditis remanei TaxID=31234 RepID=A0A6A5G1H5_CAERE|nr:hypothetical protein GCK72_025274 [Caenorhabditis remanei]KAF1748807.1 hypothetical protein GCK72_025274 [Caenorhabditis remanei]